jgi:hypothetical protein
MKAIKDQPKNVRVNSQKMQTLEERGWSTQKIVDWAMERLLKSGIRPKEKK